MAPGPTAGARLVNLLTLDTPGVEIAPSRAEDRPDALDGALGLLIAAAPEDGDGARPTTRSLRRWIDRQVDIEAALGQLVRRHGAALHRRPGVGPVAPTAALVVSPTPRTRRSGRHYNVERTHRPRSVAPVSDPVGLSVGQIRSARSALWVRNIGAILLVFLLYQWWGTGLEQHRAQAHLRLAFAKAAPTPVGGDEPALPRRPSQAQPSASAPVGHLPGGAIGRLEIPAIHVDQFVVEGTEEGDLKKGPGHYVGSSMPGGHGNAAIAGHRTTYGAPFSRLDELKAGDTIVTTTSSGRFLYVVAGLRTVAPSQSSVVDDYGDDRLTLTTCTPKFSATQRLIVTARLTGPAPPSPPVELTAPAPLASTPIVRNGPAVRNLTAAQRRGFRVRALLPAAFGATLLVVLGLGYRPVRRWLPPRAALAILGPLWCGGLLYLFEQLGRFLPPNV